MNTKVTVTKLLEGHPSPDHNIDGLLDVRTHLLLGFKLSQYFL